MVKAIETIYNGYKFRSRLEARWAVFFDLLEIEYQYEPEGFNLDGIWYLPDFYLPEIQDGLWLEIKPIEVNWADSKFFDFIYDNFGRVKYNPWEILPNCGIPGYAVLSGQPGYDEKYGGFWKFNYSATIVGDFGYYWCECPKCGRFGLEFDGRSNRLCNCFDTRQINALTPKLQAAFNSARQARFEKVL